MCGIFGIYAPEADDVEEPQLRPGLDRIRHRGPDESGNWISRHGRTGLAHARLSINDLEGGRQPLCNEDASIWAAVNGEFYDADRIRADLEAEGHRFRTRSDSEVLLHLYEKWDLQLWGQLRGEFAFLLWDEGKRRLIAGRDRFGIKPLFYSRCGERLLFASEAKALLGASAAWDEDAVLYQLFAYLPGGRSLFKGVSQVPAGHFLLAESVAADCKLIKYWDFDYPTAGEGPPAEGRESGDRFLRALEEAVRLRMSADVPVGCLLSGGIDSAAVAALGCRHSRHEMTAYTAGFDSAAFDEVPQAGETARRLGCGFRPLRIRPEDLARGLEQAVWHGEMVAINRHAVARMLLARAVRETGCKAVVSGDGADDVLAGYPYAAIDAEGGAPDDLQALAGVRQRLGFVPSWIRELATSRAAVPALLSPAMDSMIRHRDIYCEFLELAAPAEQLAGRSRLRQSLYLWGKTILPNYSLYCERLDMACGLEVRLPFLDHKLFEVVRFLPDEWLVRAGRGKYVLRDAMRGILPPAFFEQSKHPFTAPPALGEGPSGMNDDLRDALLGGDLARVPFFDHRIVSSVVESLPRQPARLRAKIEPTLLMLACFALLGRRFGLN